MNNGALAMKIMAQKAKLDSYKRELHDAVNELCLQCGQYRQEHNGACDGCRWKERRSGDIE